MANYALTVTPKFTPFTYDELIKPIETYQKVYDTYDATYEKAAEDAAKFASLDAEKDPIAYQRYQNYLQNIQKQRDALYKSGLSSSTRRGFQDLRNTYSTEIKPMEIAYDKKLEDIKNYDKMIMTNPQMRAVRNPHETPLGEYMSNLDLGNKYIDLNAVHKAAVDAFSHAQQLYITKDNLDPWTYQVITRHGESPAAIMQGLQEATKDGSPTTRSQASKIITSIMNMVRNQFGYDSIDNESVRQDIDSSILSGAWSLHGQEDIKYPENYGSRKAYDFEEWKQKQAIDYDYWKKKADYNHTLELDKIAAQNAYNTPEYPSNRYTTGLTSTGVQVNERRNDITQLRKETARIEALKQQGIEEKPFKSFKKDITREKIEGKKLEEIYQYLDDKDVKRIKNIINHPYADATISKSGINAVLAEYGIESLGNGTVRSTGNTTKQELLNKIDKIYTEYNQKYGDLYKNDENLLDAIEKYEALENADQVHEVYEATLHGGWLGNEASEKIYQTILSVANKDMIVKDSEGNELDITKLPEENKVRAVKIDTEGRLKVVDKDWNEYYIETRALNNYLNKIKVVNENFNVQVKDGKKVITEDNKDSITAENESDYIENLGYGYEKVVSKNNGVLTVWLYKDGQPVAVMNSDEILQNASQPKLTYLGNLVEETAGEISNLYTTTKPNVSQNLDEYGGLPQTKKKK